MLARLDHHTINDPAHTPARRSASFNPPNRFDQSPNRLLSEKTAAKIKEIRPPQMSVAHVTTNFCFQSVPPKLVHEDAMSSPAATEVRMVTGAVINVIWRCCNTKEAAQTRASKSSGFG
jgi:hypothetical protein